MSLRYRLFLWIGSVFIVIFVFSVYFESNLTDKHLEEAEGKLRKQLLASNETKRDRLEQFLMVSLTENQIRINTLMHHLALHPIFKMYLGPENADTQGETWYNSSNLLAYNRWIDFIQNTNDGKLSSLLVPNPTAALPARQIPVSDLFSLVIMGEGENIIGPYVGVPLSLDALRLPGIPGAPFYEEIQGGRTKTLVLFAWQTILRFAKQWDPAHPDSAGWCAHIPSMVNPQTYREQIMGFLAALHQAAGYLQQGVQEVGMGKMDAWLRDRCVAPGETTVLVSPLHDVTCFPDSATFLNKRFNLQLLRNDQAILMWAYSLLLKAGPFGSSPFDAQAPIGMGGFQLDGSAGMGFFACDVFYPEPLFNDQAYFTHFPPRANCEGIGSSLAVVDAPTYNRVFLGNTLRMEQGGKVGYITTGVDADDTLHKLVISLNQQAFLVHKGRIISAFATDGQRIPNCAIDDATLKNMLTAKSGLIKWEGVSYYFMHMVPFKGIDLHFFTLNPEEVEFALIRFVDEGGKQLIARISNDMRLVAVGALFIVLFLIHNLARRITRPITALAQVTEKVVEGRLEEIALPPASRSRHDEVGILCSSFEQMVKGLREKEKVKAVLNKVVSPEIAQEILKGKVALGGEEKVATMLFGDIRNFTGITQNMPPKEVIDMLNACMTKISAVIDQHGGVIDKYVGDEVMALFGAPVERPESALQAILSAVATIKLLDAWNVERKSQGLPPVEMGIGIHTGVVLAGNMGAVNRLNYTVLGSNVNLAARLCGAAKGMQILISESTLHAAHVQERVEVEELAPMTLKGFDKPIPVFAVKGLRP